MWAAGFEPAPSGMSDRRASTCASPTSKLVRTAGFEPASALTEPSVSGWCVYLFRHVRGVKRPGWIRTSALQLRKLALSFH
jgi:hypothetical protein